MKPIPLLFLLALFAALGAVAHPGGLDAKGGHTDRTTGIYHYHRGTNAPPGSPALKSHSGPPIATNNILKATPIQTNTVASPGKNSEILDSVSLKSLPWWVYLVGLACGYLGWEVTCYYYQKWKGSR